MCKCGHVVLCLFSLCLATTWAQEKPKSVRNDWLYPPAAAAKSSVSYDGAGFLLNGRRVYLSSGSLHYSRVPRELWADRLLRFKQANFAGVETYAFWNFHEPQEGKVDFTGDKDLGAFLETAQALGLYSIVRVGPYVCAEWDLGGYPVWLKFKPPFKVRTADPAWLAWNAQWYREVMPIVARHQIHRGGNVVLVQLENEHPLGWGVVTNNAYFDQLSDQAVKLGLEVPYFMSGLHHGGSPAPENLDPSSRANPWFTTEFWAGWFDAYRTLPEKKYRAIDNAIWSILAHGGGGHNFYMLHGGSNFDSWSDESTGASYDYGAAIGQTGDLRPMYYRMKRANQLAQSFPDILANGEDALAACKDYAAGQGVKVLGARRSRSGAGTLVFLQNSTSRDTIATFRSGEQLKLPRSSVYPLPCDVDLGSGAKILQATLPVLAVARHDQVVTVVLYGQPGETGRLTMSVKGGIKPSTTSRNFTATLSRGDEVNLKITIPAAGVEECNLEQPGRSIRLLAINRDLSLYTWLLGAGDQQYLVFGPAFVHDLRESNGQVSAVVERPYGQPACGQLAIFGARGKSWHLGVKANSACEAQPAPALANWQMSPATEAAPAFDDSGWKTSEVPLPMGADGDNGAFAWYRAQFQVPMAGSGSLHLQGGDNLEIYVNGNHVGSGKGTVKADFVSGRNTLAVFASHKGRNKAYSYTGSLDNYASKGLTGPVSLDLGGKHTEITGWKMRGGLGAGGVNRSSWGPVAGAGDLPAFYRATFQTTPPGELGAHPILRVNFAGLSRGMLWVNGHSLGRYPEKIRIDSLYIPECWLKSGENVLTVFDETGARPDRVALVVEMAASREVIRVSETVDAQTALVVPVESPPRDLVAMNRGNLAFGQPATASATAKDSAPALGTDGDPETFWTAPANATNAWLQVDLGKPQSLKMCEILWEHPARNYQYSISGSNDGQTWVQLGDETTAVPTSPDSPSEQSRLNLSGGTVRYLRVSLKAGKSLRIGELKAFASEKP